MSKAVGGEVLRIGQTGNYGDSSGDIGKVSFAADGTMQVIENDALSGIDLYEIADTINERQNLRIKMPPPNGEDGGVWWRDIGRDDPDLVDALPAYLEQKYALYCNLPDDGQR